MKAFLLATVLGCLLLAVIAVGVFILSTGGTTDLPPSTWVLMIVGTLFAIAIGVGLMALAFFSSRRGYDEGAQHHGQNAPKLPPQA